MVQGLVQAEERRPPGARWTLLAGGILLAVGLAGLAAGGMLRWLALPALAWLTLGTFGTFRRLRTAEQALAKSRIDYRRLIDLPAQATWIADEHGRLTSLSERWTECFTPQ